MPGREAATGRRTRGEVALLQLLQRLGMLGRWIHRKRAIIVLVLAGLGALSGLTLLVQRGIDPWYVRRLQIHVVVGAATGVWFAGSAVAWSWRALGAGSTLLKLPIYAFLVLAIRLPMTGEIVIALTLLPLWLDWRLTRRRLVQLGCDAAALQANRWRYLDFAFVAVCLLTGRNLTYACLPFVLVFHKIHGLALLALPLWFVLPRLRAMRAALRWRAVAGLLLLSAIVLPLYYDKQVRRDDDSNPHRSDVHQTVERASEAARIRPLDAASLNGSAGCAGADCHGVIVSQWRGSTHRFSVNNRFFQKEIELFVQMEGPENVRPCINCHDPVAALSRDGDALYAQGRIDNSEGISCKACHIITHVDKQRGNGLYTVKAPERFPDADFVRDSHTPKTVDAALPSDPRVHLRNFQRSTYYRAGEYCITCHLVTLPDAGAAQGPMHLHTLFDQWQKSDWPKYQNCVDCHLPRFQLDENGYTFFDHRLMGINTDLGMNAKPEAGDEPYIKQFTDFTERFVAGTYEYCNYPLMAEPIAYKFAPGKEEKLSPFTLYSFEDMRRFFATMYMLSGGPPITLSVELPHALRDGDKLDLGILTTNARVGHNFPSGPIDVQETWLEASLEDKDKRVIAHLGALDSRNRVEAGAPILGSHGIVDALGNKLIHHEFWRAQRVLDKRVLAPRASLRDAITLAWPHAAPGSYTLRVRWNFRRMNQDIVDWVWPGENRSAHVLVLDESVYALTVDRAATGAVTVQGSLRSRPTRKAFDDLGAMWWRSMLDWKSVRPGCTTN